MKQMIIQLFMILMCLNCSSNIRLRNNLEKKEHIIAVVPFTGKGVNKNLCYSAADELTRLLFIEKNINVIARSRVNAAMAELKIENPYYFSTADLKMFSDNLDASSDILLAYPTIPSHAILAAACKSFDFPSMESRYPLIPFLSTSS